LTGLRQAGMTMGGDQSITLLQHQLKAREHARCVGGTAE
jgi:hypothetical protein